MFLEWVLYFCLFALFAATGLALYRIIIGPNAADRTIAFDIVAMGFMSIICIVCMLRSQSLYFDAIWILTLVGFIGSAAIARYLEKGRVF